MSKRILFIAPQPFFVERGSPIRAMQCLRAMAGAGYEVDILCYPFGRAMDIPGVHVIRSLRVPGIATVKVGPSLAKIPLDLLLAFKAFALCLRHRYDVIDAVEESAFFATWLKRLFRCKLVYHMDSLISEQLEYSGFLRRRNRLLAFTRWLERRTIRCADLSITVSEDIAAKVRRRLPDRPVVVIEDAPLHETFPDVAATAEALRREHGLERGTWIVAVYTGNCAGYQGVDLLLDAVALLRNSHPNLKTAVIGAMGENSRRLEARVRALGIGDRCLFLGIRPLDEISAWLAAADILASPRIAGTNTPLKVYSYMQSCTPIVATRLTVHTNVLNPDTAVLTEPTPEAFARGIEELILDPERGRLMGMAAGRAVHANYSLQHFRDKTVAALSRVTGAESTLPVQEPALEKQ